MLPDRSTESRFDVANYREALPQLHGSLFLTDSGLETDLTFHHGQHLDHFAAFPLLDRAAGRATLARYYRDHAAPAQAHGTGFVLEAPTWRANADWGGRLGYGPGDLRSANQRAIDLLVELRGELAGHPAPVVVSGCIGPRANGYSRDTLMSADDAQAYHHDQIASFAPTEADLITAMTITYPAEAIGIVRAAGELGLPAVVSFTVETDGQLPDGTSLADAVRRTDDATGRGAAYFMINCAHPDHIEPALEPGADWMHRVRGLRANASRRSHAELDAAPDLDDGDSTELALDYQRLLGRAPDLTVLGGCCGTDVRHVAAIASVLSR
jgi:homocysteine S-methyltransferase